MSLPSSLTTSWKLQRDSLPKIIPYQNTMTDNELIEQAELLLASARELRISAAHADNRTARNADTLVADEFERRANKLLGRNTRYKEEELNHYKAHWARQPHTFPKPPEHVRQQRLVIQAMGRLEAFFGQPRKAL